MTGEQEAMKLLFKYNEDLILADHISAKAKLKNKTTEEISKVAGGFGIPGFKWPL